MAIKMQLCLLALQIQQGLGLTDMTAFAGQAEPSAEELVASADGDTMEALEAVTAQQGGTKLPGFVSAGIVQPEKGQQATPAERAPGDFRKFASTFEEIAAGH